MSGSHSSCMNHIKNPPYMSQPTEISVLLLNVAGGGAPCLQGNASISWQLSRLGGPCSRTPPRQRTPAVAPAATQLPGWQAKLLLRDVCSSWLPVGSPPASQIQQPVTTSIHHHTVQEEHGRPVNGGQLALFDMIATMLGHRRGPSMLPTLPPVPTWRRW